MISIFFFVPFFLACSDSVDSASNPVPQSNSISSEIVLSSLEGASSISESFSQGASSSELSSLAPSSSQMNGQSSLHLDELELLWLNIPSRLISQETEFWLTWEWNVSPEDLSGEVEIFYQKLDENFELSDETKVSLGKASVADSLLLDLSSLENGSRIRLLIEYLENPKVQDQSVYFDVHNGLTPYTYEADLRPFFSSYCVSCHGNSGGLSLSSYSSVTDANTPLYIMNRVNFIGDMPEVGELQPTQSEREMLRDWILGNYPEN